jgi:hypothetical protein
MRGISSGTAEMTPEEWALANQAQWVERPSPKDINRFVDDGIVAWTQAGVVLTEAGRAEIGVKGAA